MDCHRRHQMSLNERIAKYKELDYQIDKAGYLIVRDEFCASEHWITIDYTKDPKLILELVLELIHEDWDPVSVRYSADKMIYGWSHRQKCPLPVKDFDFGIATAMAYCEEKGL